MKFAEFIRWEEEDKKTVKVKCMYIDLADGDIVAGLLLSQIIYWHLPSKAGKNKLRVFKDNKFWLAKGRNDWWGECRITPRQFDRAVDILVNKGVVEKKLYRFGGSPTIHVHLNEDALMEQINNIIKGDSFLRNGEMEKVLINESVNSNSPESNMELTNTVKTLTYTTTKSTNIDQDTGEKHAGSFNEEQSTSKSIKELPKHLSVPSKFTAAKKDDPIDQVVERVMHREKKVILKKPKFNTNTMIAYFSESFKEFFDGATPPIELQKDRGLMKKLIDHYEYDFVKEMIDWAFNNYAQFRREKKIDGVLTIGIIFGFRAYLQDKIQHRFVDTESEW